MVKPVAKGKGKGVKKPQKGTGEAKGKGKAIPKPKKGMC